ncbi:MAG TPA: ABC transporter permease [bacterium]|nr:ABC transporter permease [bacterium]
MTRYIARRLISLFPILLGVSAVAFLIVHLIPGDPATVYVGEHATPGAIERVQHEFGLDKPLPVQYGIYLWNALHGDFGESLDSHRKVLVEYAPRFPATVELTLGALAVALVLGVPIGILSAAKPNSVFDRLGMVFALSGVSIPVFWLALMLIFIFSVYVHALPTSGQLGVNMTLRTLTGIDVLDGVLTGNWPAAWDALRHLVLPSVTVGSIPTAIIARMTRASMLDALHQDYIRTARAKGLTGWAVVVAHGLRNALLPVVTVVGLQFGSFLTGAVLTETLFSWPGVGRFMYDSILFRDYPVILAGILFFSLFFVIVNLAVDVLYAFLDPRIRYA